MIIRTNWATYVNSPSNLFYTREETQQEVIDNFDVRRLYSNEGYSVSIDGVSENVIIQDHSNPLNENKTDKKILVAMDSTLHTGSYVTYDGGTWITVSRINTIGNAYKSAKIVFCNHTLNFLDSNLRPTSRPCYVENTSYGTDETAIRIFKVNITTGAGTYRIVLPYDAQTALFDRTYADTNQNQRIMLLKKSYEITDVDFITQLGCVIITAEECERSADDNVELGIADYNRVKTTSTLPRCEITYSGEPVLEYGKAAKTFTAKFYDLDGNLLEATPAWNVVMTNQSLLEFVASATEVNDIYLRVTDKRLIGESIKLEVADAVGSMSAYVMIGVESIG